VSPRSPDAAEQAARWLAQLEVEVPLMLSRDRPAAIERITGAYGDYLDALEHYIDSGEMTPMSRMVRGLRVYWEGTGKVAEGRVWIARTLSRPEAETRTPARAMLLDHAACLALSSGDFAAAIAGFRECLAVRREVGPASLLPVTLSHLGIGLRSGGDLPGARAAFDECIRLCEETGEDEILSGALYWCARVAVDEGDLDEAQALLDRSLVVRRSHEHTAPWQHGVVMLVRAVMAAKTGKLREARRLFDDGVARMAENGGTFEDLPAYERAWFERPVSQAVDKAS